MKPTGLFLLVLGMVASCSRDRMETDAGLVSAPAAITIMTFNAQNLFDNVDDPGKDDKAYLPLAAKQNDAHREACAEIEVTSWRDECLNLDWSDAAVDHKLSALAEAIRQVDAGNGPDIIAFQEVEKSSILDRLSFEYLRDANYGPAILIEGDDIRGIDVAFLSRLPLLGPPVLHPVTFENFPDRQGDTRGVLQATFRLPDGAPLTGFAVHFPAPFHPPEMRVTAYEHLNRLRQSVPDDHAVFAAGDFNTVNAELYAGGVLDTFLRPNWMVALDYCEGCKGTYYYARDGNWSFLDMILFSPARGEKTTWQLRADSVRVVNSSPDQVTPDGGPKRYDAAAFTGVSDHWPLVLAIANKKIQ